MQIGNQLTEIREKRGISVSALAREVGISRQTVYAIEAGDYVPNTVVALRLARTLAVHVEDLFCLENTPPPELPTAAVELLGTDEGVPGTPVQLCRVDRRLMAVPSDVETWQLPAADGVLDDAAAEPGAKTRARLFEKEEPSNRLLVAGCDPAISVLARHLQRVGVELVVVRANSSQALQLLKDRKVHVAGTHLKDPESGESNLPEVVRRFSKNSVAVINFAVWEQGLVVARDNPKAIKDVTDLARRGVRFVNREEGSGSRLLLDAELKRRGVSRSSVTGYNNVALGHLPAAWQVHEGMADCCLATRAAARVFGLTFLPLASERYDFVLRREHLELATVAKLLDVLAQSHLRHELEQVGGYDTHSTGERLM